MLTSLHNKDYREQLTSTYKKQQHPFPHVGVEPFFNDNDAEQMFEEIMEFANKYGSQFWQYNGVSERSKWTYNKVEDKNFPRKTKEALCDVLNSADFIGYLEKVTGFRNLLPDNAFTGGGIHITHGTGSGGILKPHKDFNILPATLESDQQWHRVLNVITYLNPYWKPAYKGDLILWKEDAKVNWEDDPTGLLEEVTIRPKFNSALVFDTRETIHGQKEPYLGPNEFPRVSLATYYYQIVSKGDIIPHSTVYYMLPGEQETYTEKKERIERASISRYVLNRASYKDEFDRFQRLNQEILLGSNN